MGMFKIIGAIAAGVACGGAALYIDNKVRKEWIIPDHFPDKIPLVGGKKIPILGGLGFEAGWAVLPGVLVLGIFGLPFALVAGGVAGVSASEGNRLLTQWAPRAFLPPDKAAAVQGLGIHVGKRPLVSDATLTERMEALVRKAVPPSPAAASPAEQSA